ncbi:MAG TPA: GAF domain-containing protein [Gammaproteobacteria bacterium]|jgi:GAF domain-containing protein
MNVPEEIHGPGRSQIEIENAALQAEAGALRSFIHALKSLMDALESPRAESEILEILESVLGNAIRAVNARDGSLLIPDSRTGELVFVIVRGETANNALIGKRIPTGKGVASWVAATRRAVIVNNAAADERFYDRLDQEIRYKTDSLLAAPLIGGGRVIGVIEVINKNDGKLFTMGNQTLLSVMCRFAGELLYTVVNDNNLAASGFLRKFR